MCLILCPKWQLNPSEIETKGRGTKFSKFPLGTDTFVFKDGKIVAQTFAVKIEPKNA